MSLTFRCDSERPPASTRCPPVPSGRHDQRQLGRHPSDARRTGSLAAWTCRTAWRAVACARSAAGAQIVTVMLDQVEGVQHHLTSPASVPQRMEVRRPVVAGDHGLAIDQERRGLEAERGIDDGRKAVAATSWNSGTPVGGMKRFTAPSGRQGSSSAPAADRACPMSSSGRPMKYTFACTGPSAGIGTTTQKENWQYGRTGSKPAGRNAPGFISITITTPMRPKTRRPCGGCWAAF